MIDAFRLAFGVGLFDAPAGFVEVLNRLPPALTHLGSPGIKRYGAIDRHIVGNPLQFLVKERQPVFHALLYPAFGHSLI